MAKANWITEFGTGYAVPEEITNTLIDVSWHNDTAPSFNHPDAPADWDRFKDEHDLRLWVEHPDPALREFPGAGRFCVAECNRFGRGGFGSVGQTFILTENLSEALAVLAREAAKIKDKRFDPQDPTGERNRAGSYVNIERTQAERKPS